MCQHLGLDGIRGLLSVSRVTSSFRAATTEGNRFAHSVDRSPEGSRISWAYWCPKCLVEALHDALVPVDVHPTAPNLDRVLRQQLTDGTHELAPRVNLKELRPPQGATLVNQSKAISDLCRSLASQGHSLFVAAGDVNDRESITEVFCLTRSCGKKSRSAWWTSFGTATSNFGRGMCRGAGR